jgi:hypothetical protein
MFYPKTAWCSIRLCGLHIRTRPRASKLDILPFEYENLSVNSLGGVFQFSHTLHITRGSTKMLPACPPRVIGKQQLRPLHVCACTTPSFFKWALSSMQCALIAVFLTRLCCARRREKSIRPHTGRSQCEAIMLPTWLSSSNAVMNVVLFITPRSVFQTLLPLRIRCGHVKRELFLPRVMPRADKTELSLHALHIHFLSSRR